MDGARAVLLEDLGDEFEDLVVEVRQIPKANLRLDPVQDLPDVSFRADVFDSVADRRRQHPVRVRVVSYTIEHGRDPVGPYPLITAALD